MLEEKVRSHRDKLLEEEETVSPNTSLLILMTLLSILMGVIYYLLQHKSPKQHRYKKRQLYKLNANLKSAKIVKKVSYVVQE